MLLIEWLHLIRISLLQTLQNIIGRTWVFKSVPPTCCSHVLSPELFFTRVKLLYYNIKYHLLKQRHHKQILRFRHHLVRTLLLLCCHLIQTLCWQRYQGQVPLPGYNRHISICHIFEACKPLRKLREQGTIHCSLTIPLQHLSVTSIESLCKHTKALFAKFLVKFAHKTASSSTSSWDLGLKHDVLTLKGNFAKQAELISSLIDA